MYIVKSTCISAESCGAAGTDPAAVQDNEGEAATPELEQDARAEDKDQAGAVAQIVWASARRD
jgi:hypothetical protein